MKDNGAFHAENRDSAVCFEKRNAATLILEHKVKSGEKMIKIVAPYPKCEKKNIFMEHPRKKITGHSMI